MGAHLGISVFDYIERAGAKSPVFYNTVYCPELQQAVLRPFSHLSDLVLWDYYTGEEMRHGPPYDPEYADLDLASDEEVKSLVGDLSGYGPAKSTLTQGDYSVDLDLVYSISSVAEPVCFLPAPGVFFADSGSDSYKK